MLDCANEKSKAVLTFVAYHVGVVKLLDDRFKSWKTEKTHAVRLQMAKNINEIIEYLDTAVATLAGKFPELEQLVLRLLGNRIQQNGCIQYTEALNAESTG